MTVPISLFLLLLPETDTPGAQILARCILQDLREKRGFVDGLSDVLGRKISVPEEKFLGCSIGIAVYTGDTDLASFLKLADGALCTAKTNGKGRYETAL